MKKTLISSALLLVLSSGIAFAETTSTSTASTTKGTAILKIQELKSRLASTTSGIKSDIENRIGKKLDNQRTKIANEFEVAIRNLKKLVERVEAVIVKLESKGNDLSSQRTLLADAKAKIEIADNSVTALENALSATTTPTTKRAVLKVVKTEAEKARADIKAAHRAIVKIISSLKPGREEKKQATSTESTATSSVSTSTATTTSN